MSIDDKWYEQQTDGLSDCLQELITDGGAAKAHQGLCDAIMTWIDYHQQELNKWTELATLVRLPMGTDFAAGSQAQNLKNSNTPSTPIENKQ